MILTVSILSFLGGFVAGALWGLAPLKRHLKEIEERRPEKGHAVKIPWARAHRRNRR